MTTRIPFPHPQRLLQETKLEQTALWSDPACPLAGKHRSATAQLEPISYSYAFFGWVWVFFTWKSQH